MESKWPRESIRILRRVVTMVPRCPILRRFELVCKMIIWCDRALRYCVNTIILKRIKQSHSMPVNRGTVEVKLINDGNLELISPTSLDEGPGVGIVKGFATITALIAIGVDWVFIDIKRVLRRSLCQSRTTLSKRYLPCVLCRSGHSRHNR